jgi:hypothetical protein
MLHPADSADGEATRAKGPVTRRGALMRLASAGVLAAGNVGSALASADPILAAIERHRAAWLAVGDLCRAIDDVAGARRGQQVAQDDLEAYERASATAERALQELLATPPESLDGMRAAVIYILGFDAGFMTDLAGPFLATLLKSPILAG